MWGTNDPLTSSPFVVSSRNSSNLDDPLLLGGVPGISESRRYKPSLMDEDAIFDAAMRATTSSKRHREDGCATPSAHTPPPHCLSVLTATPQSRPAHAGVGTGTGTGTAAATATGTAAATAAAR